MRTVNGLFFMHAHPPLQAQRCPRAYVHSFINSDVCSLDHSFIRSFVRPFFLSFVHSSGRGLGDALGSHFHKFANSFFSWTVLSSDCRVHNDYKIFAFFTCLCIRPSFSNVRILIIRSSMENPLLYQTYLTLYPKSILY